MIEELLAKCKSQDEMLAGLDKYKSQRRVYEKKVNNLKSEITKLNNKLGKDAMASKEREAAISDMNKKLKGVSRTKEIINVCLSEASVSIRAALALEVMQAFYLDVWKKTQGEKNSKVKPKAQKVGTFLKLSDVFL